MADSKPMDDSELEAINDRLDGYAPQVKNDILRLMLEIARLRKELAQSRQAECVGPTGYCPGYPGQ